MILTTSKEEYVRKGSDFIPVQDTNFEKISGDLTLVR